MAKEEGFNFLSGDGKTQIHAIKWMPEAGECRAVLQIVHGMLEFVERYREFAEYLTGYGYMVVGHDHIGHGASVTSESDRGYFAKEHPSDLLIGDMHKLHTVIQKEIPDKPYFILGHSMGSYLLRKYLVLYGAEITGAILMGTGYVPDKMTRFGMHTAKFLSLFFGWKHRSRLLTKMTFGKPYRKYDLTGADTGNSWLTKEKDIVDFYYHEPRCTFVFTLNGYMGLFETVLFGNQPQHIAKVPKELPVFIVSGAQDPVGEFGKGVRQVYTQYEQAGLLDITWKLYEDDRHEILNESDRETVYHDILAWLNVHTEM